MIPDKIKLLEAVALLLAAQQDLIDLTADDNVLIGKALGNHALKA